MLRACANIAIALVLAVSPCAAPSAAPTPSVPARVATLLICQPPIWVVFFDRGSAILTAEALQQLASFPAFVRDRGLRGLELVGNADTTGSATSNQGLSLRRAEAVSRALVAFGVPADLIVVRAAGETELLLPTPDAVDERLNRYVSLHPRWVVDTGC